MGAQDSYPSGYRRHRRKLAAAKAHGDSMTGLKVKNGDIVLFERVDPGTIVAGLAVVIEKVGDEESFGSLALKKLVVKEPRLARHDSFGNEVDWDDPVIVLHSRNRKVLARALDPTGQYRVHGIFLRAVPPDETHLVDSEDLRRLLEGTEEDPEVD